ncbi:golgin subfamily A member 6C-like [Pongo pygmaeus]|uniref:golgin subfamily A member 6C-like n=1 Tax=Pongo pygmaeus TaxID=9600 RepID=UPI0023E25FD2|nr:golgin subfamily A member 6C-like [Pongo pygmaeus]
MFLSFSFRACLAFLPNMQFQTINILTLEKADLKTTLYHTKRAARHFEEESKDLAGHLQHSLWHIKELEWALSAVSTQQQEEDRSSSCSEAVLQRQLHQSIKERALLNAHVTQVTESLKQVQLERDEYAQHIKGERARWQERMWKMSVEAHTLKEEKKRDTHRIQELERSLSELKNQMAEPPSSVPPGGPSEVEQLQDEAKHLRKEVESLMGNLQSQGENNQALSLLSKEQRERLRKQEWRLQEQEERRLREQEGLCEQKERLRGQQERLRGQGERLQKQEVRLRKQEERLRKEEERLRKQEERLQEKEERLWEKEERLQKQEERLRKQEERLALSRNQKLNKQLAEPQCSFEDLNNKNKSTLQLEQQVKELQEKLSKEMEEDIWTVRRRRHLSLCQASQRTWRARRPWCTLRPQVKGLCPTSLPHLFWVCPYKNTQLLPSGGIFQLPGASAQEKQAWLCGQRKVRRLCCQHLAHLVASAWKEPEAEALVPGTGGEFVCREIYRALQGAMEKLKSGFMDFLEEKADRKEQVEKPELGFIKLSGATEGEYLTIYESQGVVPNRRHREKEDVIRLAQNEEEMKVKLLELQELVLPLVGDHKGHDKFIAAAQNPADEPPPGAPAPQELGAADEQGDPCLPFSKDLCEVSLDDSVEPAPGAAREGSPDDNPTAQQILQLPPVMQDTQEHPGLPSKPCMPFFYRAAKNRR